MKISNPKTDGEFRDFEPDHDEIGRRYVEAGGKKYRFIFKDPHGFLQIVPEKGKLPVELSGLYTTQFEAERAITRYHSQVK